MPLASVIDDRDVEELGPISRVLTFELLLILLTL
jgi:hypothetical protein